MTVKCLALCTNELIGLAAEDLLKDQVDLKIIDARFLHEERLTRFINRYRPNILIVDQLDGNIDLNTIFKILRPLVQVSRIRIIVLDQQANVAHIYEVKDVPVNQVSDLLSIVRD